METEMAIASIEFGNLSSTPSTPPSGKKVFLGTDDQFKTVDSTGAVAPLGGGDVVEYPDKLSFPSLGRINRIYIALDTTNPWRWSAATSQYVLFLERIDAGIYP
jgi:hypothetical protein